MTTSDAGPANQTAEQPDLEEDGVDRLDAIARDLAGVEEALVRLDDGTYGRCEVCEQEIGDEVLTEHPARSLCEAHLPVV